MKTGKKVVVLAYHSQIISGLTYATNDHVALDQDLIALREKGFRVIRATQLVAAIQSRDFSALPARCAVITLDDGPIFDFEDADFPPYGRQEAMLNILKRRHSKLLGFRVGRPPVVMTCFVIASPQARQQIEGPLPGSMTDRWWAKAQASGYIDIGSHSWNHVHPAVDEVRFQGLYAEAFHKIDTHEEAERQIVQAARHVRAITRHDAARLFAYPYGQRSEFMVREFLPNQSEVVAAFTTDAAFATEDSSIWEIPRFVCNWHWKSEAQFRSLLDSNACSMH